MLKIKSISFSKKSALFCSAALFSLVSCVSQPASKSLEMWLTTGDETVKLQRQDKIPFSEKSKDLESITIDDSKKFQTVDGFGYTLTGGSVEVINRLDSAKRQQLLQELFGNSANSISVSYLRFSIGASDLDREVFSYDDIPAGQTDMNLKKFSLEKNRALISMLKEILKINPKIKIIAAPWSAPVWMKDNGKTIGGSLKPEYYNVYARYFVKYIEEMQREGITIDAVTPQNEPLHPGNNPSLYMSWEQQRDFIKNHLGPEFRKANLKTKIIVYDHNLNKPEYAINILNDPEAKKYIDGSAFHLYEGEVSAMSKVHTAHPDKNLYFTEQWTGSKSDFQGDLDWHMKNVIIGTMRNWSKIALEWNVANDQNFEPHTPGGCTECKGAVTVFGKDAFIRNVSYYIIAHASKFVLPNSVRISSTEIPGVSNVAFKTPQGKIVLIVSNENNNVVNFNINFKNKNAAVGLPKHSVATFVF